MTIKAVNIVEYYIVCCQDGCKLWLIHHGIYHQARVKMSYVPIVSIDTHGDSLIDH